MVRMLVVDDEIEICDFLKNFFTERKYEVSTALNGKEAIRQIKEKDPQIMLLDVRMPGASGIDVLREVHELGGDCKVLMVTAIEDKSMMALARELGAHDYITKPFSLDYLENSVLHKVDSLTGNA